MICNECANIIEVAGQGFTEYTCNICETTKWHYNTKVPKVCEKCSKKYNVCERCGRKIDKNGNPINE